MLLKIWSMLLLQHYGKFHSRKRDYVFSTVRTCMCSTIYMLQDENNCESLAVSLSDITESNIAYASQLCEKYKLMEKQSVLQSSVHFIPG